MCYHYKALLKRSHKIQLFTSLVKLIEWDQQALMPAGGIDIRIQQLELLYSLIHKESTSIQFEKVLSKFVDIKTGDPLPTIKDSRKRAALREWGRDFLLAKKLSSDFVKTFAMTVSQATNQWVKAKKDHSFTTFLPHFEKIISLVQKKAQLIGWKHHPYDALLMLYEPGVTTKDLDALFMKLIPFLKQLLQRMIKKSSPDTTFLSYDFPKDKQRIFIQYLLKKMGLHPNGFRLDYSEHPFCSGLHPHDIRITTNMEWPFFHNLFAVIHEGGHALYEAGLSSDEPGSSLNRCSSFGIHESQALWWETYIGSSRPFIQWMLPKLKEIFPKQLSSITFDQFYQTINIVKPSPIRIFSDEATYILHIIIRYEIEKALLEGTLIPADLPVAWEQKMKQFLGIVPQNHTEGCLQDIHWARGLFGYFPSYALGKIYSGQIFQTFQQLFPDWEQQISNGNFIFMNDFFSSNIHRFGREFWPQELIQRITGSPISSEPLVDYLKKKYQF